MELTKLKDPNVLPTKEVLAEELGDSYIAFEGLMEIITNNEYALVPEWNYYKDGKAWLCKVTYKKKTVFWLSVWDKYFRIVFYFTEKNCLGITELDIKESIKEDFARHKPIGKLLPLIINVENKDQINDLIKVIEYKKALK